MALKTYKKWDIILVDLNPVKGSEMAKIRPCLIISPNAVNTYMNTIIVVPFTSKPRDYPFRISTSHKGIPGELCFDHMKSIDKSRIIKSDGALDNALRSTVNALLINFFDE
jgi:mRNA interferase MazF